MFLFVIIELLLPSISSKLIVVISVLSPQIFRILELYRFLLMFQTFLASNALFVIGLKVFIQICLKELRSVQIQKTFRNYRFFIHIVIMWCFIHSCEGLSRLRQIWLEGLILGLRLALVNARI